MHAPGSPLTSPRQASWNTSDCAARAQETVQSLGPLGPVLFIATVAAFECIPLFPTQPLSLASGLVFGAGPGACYNIIGACCAASLAFYFSRTIGRGLAARLVAQETGEGGGAAAGRLESVKATIANGTLVQQFTAMLLLRLTPVVPFSASSYVLGMTPVPYAPFLAATVTGMMVWGPIYATLGGAGRGLLTSGVDLEEVLARLGQQAGGASEKIAWVALASGGVALAAFLVQRQRASSD